MLGIICLLSTIEIEDLIVFPSFTFIAHVCPFHFPIFEIQLVKTEGSKIVCYSEASKFAWHRIMDASRAKEGLLHRAV